MLRLLGVFISLTPGDFLPDDNDPLRAARAMVLALIGGVVLWAIIGIFIIWVW